MINNFLKLFTSGAIFNPLVMMGIALGLYCQFSLTAEQISSLFFNYKLYIFAVFASILFVVFFKKIYKDNRGNLDVSAMIGLIIWNSVKFVLSALLTISFVILISF